MRACEPDKTASRPRAGSIRLSIIVPCYNSAATVEQTIRSVLDHPRRDVELICVDDGSSDETPSILRDWAERDRRLSVLHTPHAGAGAARNAGLRAARGDWIIFLDSDDLMRPGALDVLLRAASRHDRHTIVAPGYELVSHTGVPLGVIRLPSDGEWSLDAFLQGNRLPPMSLVPRALLGCDPVDESLTGCIDWDLWLRLVERGARRATLPRVLFEYRLRRGSLSHRPRRMYAAACRLLERWLPKARDPQRLRWVRHRLAVNYGAMGLAAGDHRLLADFWNHLPAFHPDPDTLDAFAWHIRGAFEFVRGAEGETWNTHCHVWLSEADDWLEHGPLHFWALHIMQRLRDMPFSPERPADRLWRLLRTRGGVWRIVVYGLGNNGIALLENLRRDPRFDSYELAVADDHLPDHQLVVHELPIDRPARWQDWPSGTVVAVTPQDAGPMKLRLFDCGGIPDRDFVHTSVVRRVSESLLTPAGQGESS